MAALVHSTLWHVHMKFILVTFTYLLSTKKKMGIWVLLFDQNKGSEFMACDTAMTFKLSDQSTHVKLHNN